MPRLEIRTMGNHELSFLVHPPIHFFKGLSGNNHSRFFMVRFGNQSLIRDSHFGVI
jgi:hypothetical protein